MRRRAWALSVTVLLSVGCSVRLPPSQPPAPSATTAPTNPRPSPPLDPTLIPAPTVAWQMADLGDLASELVAFTDIAAGRDGLVALGVLQDRPAGNNLRLLASPDGIAWRLVDWPADANVRSIAAADGVVWAFGRQPADALETSVWTTDDGTAWTEMDLTGVELGVGRAIDLVGAGDSLMMLVHRAPNPEDYSSVVLRTDDGVRWADVPPVRDISWGLHTLTGDERGYVVTYTNGASGPPGIDEAWFSPDGVEWTAHPLPGAGDGVGFVDSAAARGTFVIGGSTLLGEGTIPAVWSSNDGNSWSLTRLEEEALGSVGVVLPAADGFVGLGWMSDSDLQRTRSWWSPDGASWVVAGDLPPFGYAMAGVEWDERLIAVGGVNEADGSVSPAIWVGTPGR